MMALPTVEEEARSSPGMEEKPPEPADALLLLLLVSLIPAAAAIAACWEAEATIAQLDSLTHSLLLTAATVPAADAP